MDVSVSAINIYATVALHTTALHNRRRISNLILPFAYSWLCAHENLPLLCT